MHGLTVYEREQLARLRQINATFEKSGDIGDLLRLRDGVKSFVKANKRRRVIRGAAARTIKFAYAAQSMQRQIAEYEQRIGD